MSSSIRSVQVRLSVASVAVVVGGLVACAPPSQQVASGGAGPDHGVERGAYLVNQVGMCQDCHTPRLPTGAFDEKLWLQGSPLGFAPVAPIPFVTIAPRIAGLPNGWTDAHMEEFLQTGKKPGGVVCSPPMPEYRFNEDDAKAVTAYLKSLPSTPKTQ